MASGLYPLCGLCIAVALFKVPPSPQFPPKPVNQLPKSLLLQKISSPEVPPGKKVPPKIPVFLYICLPYDKN